MFEMLISSKKEVSIRCGKDEIKGIIANYYHSFQLLKMNNILIPIELIEQIEVLEPESTSALSHIHHENKGLRLVSHRRHSN
ncbi:hypothetical protein SAMN04487897_102394 [Paenibacillus sp. yr247]|uniref:hypothetical protein n=1 Tax=Paenibacillus sp. yr247 TaxID=1761880 RepID=UPI00088511DB|nr:hypothetical protein [Paenibacillus sp. yr247]SDN28826.1 hypothetical protein SAMN04487897_102394 [Paenibacillus sp. yr247]